MTCYVDSSAFLALADRRDQHHEAATEAYRRLVAERSRRVTSLAVLHETITLLRFRVDHVAAAGFLRTLPETGIHVLPHTDALEARARSIFLKFGDHELSFVDCVSFPVVEIERLPQALTLDGDFRIFPFRHSVEILP